MNSKASERPRRDWLTIGVPLLGTLITVAATIIVVELSARETREQLEATDQRQRVRDDRAELRAVLDEAAAAVNAARQEVVRIDGGWRLGASRGSQRELQLIRDVQYSDQRLRIRLSSGEAVASYQEAAEAQLQLARLHRSAASRRNRRRADAARTQMTQAIDGFLRAATELVGSELG